MKKTIYNLFIFSVFLFSLSGFANHKQAYKAAYDYALSYHGLNLNPDESTQFATQFVKSGLDLAAFKAAHTYALSYRGLNLKPNEAIKFATQFVESGLNLAAFKAVYTYAEGYRGLNLKPNEAIKFATQFVEAGLDLDAFKTAYKDAERKKSLTEQETLEFAHNFVKSRTINNDSKSHCSDSKHSCGDQASIPHANPPSKANVKKEAGVSGERFRGEKLAAHEWDLCVAEFGQKPCLSRKSLSSGSFDLLKTMHRINDSEECRALYIGAKSALARYSSTPLISSNFERTKESQDISNIINEFTTILRQDCGLEQFQ